MNEVSQNQAAIHPAQLQISEFQYDLPEEKVARYPLPERDKSKLLVYRDGAITDDIYCNLGRHLQPTTLLLFNNTKVIEARMYFEKPTGGVIEIFCLEPADGKEISYSMLRTGKVRWNCLVGGAAKWKEKIIEKKIDTPAGTIHLFAEIAERLHDCFVIEFSWHDPSYAFAEVLHAAGVIPLPPYLHRKAEQLDYDRYQTVYARQEGSVAAPTAGLHFTQPLLDALQQQGVMQAFVTLHVGAGTFKPVKAATMKDHEMHKEWIHVQRTTIEDLLNYHPKDIIPVGTTSLRTVETLYWMGVKALQQPTATIAELEVQQWDVYQLPHHGITTEQALQALIGWMNDHQLEELICQTQLLIAPGYKMKLADALLTNFHQPGSTLLLLVSALVGEDWRNIYNHALANDYRFLSYGDGSLLWARKD